MGYSPSPLCCLCQKLSLALFTLIKLCYMGSAGKESACNVGDLGLNHELRRYPGEGKGYPLLFSGLKNSIDFIAHGVAKSPTWLSDFHFHTKALEWSSLVPGPEAKSSEIMNPTSFTVSYQWPLKVWGRQLLEPLSCAGYSAQASHVLTAPRGSCHYLLLWQRKWKQLVRLN